MTLEKLNSNLYDWNKKICLELTNFQTLWYSLGLQVEEKVFETYFLRVPHAVGQYCSCHAAQAKQKKEKKLLENMVQNLLLNLLLSK